MTPLRVNLDVRGCSSVPHASSASRGWRSVGNEDPMILLALIGAARSEPSTPSYRTGCSPRCGLGHSNLQCDLNDIGVRSFILTGAPLRNTLSPPKTADSALRIMARPFAEIGKVSP
jgi:hypothetical protein